MLDSFVRTAKKRSCGYTSTRADACAFTTAPPFAVGSRRVRLPRNLHACVEGDLGPCLETLLRNWHSCQTPWSVFRKSNDERLKKKNSFFLVWEPGTGGQDVMMQVVGAQRGPAPYTRRSAMHRSKLDIGGAAAGAGGMSISSKCRRC